MKVLNIKDEYGKTANVLHFHGRNIDQLTNTFKFIYNEHIVNSNYDKDKLAIVSTWTDDEKCCLYQQCKRFNIPTVNCVPKDYDNTQKWYMPNKIRFFIDILEQTKQDIVMFLDGYDVLLTHLDDIIERFESQRYRILFGPSCNNYPDVRVDVIRGRTTKGVYRYFNAGCVIGYRQDLLDFYNQALEYLHISNPWNSEQFILRQVFAKYSNKDTQNFVGVDFECNIFRSMGVTDSSYDTNKGEILFKTNKVPKKYIIVTGSEGTVGKILVEQLMKDPINVIYEVDRKKGLEAANIDFLFNLRDIDIVYHLAETNDENNKQQMIKDNIETFTKIVDLCYQYGTKLIYLSPSSDYRSLYNMCKRFEEEYVRLYYPGAVGVKISDEIVEDLIKYGE